MARNYDRLIKYYDSWFDDLLDPDKGFTREEIADVLIAIRQCQQNFNLEPLQALPREIRRGLSMATLSEQILRICERTQSIIERGSKGGNKTAAAAARSATQENKRDTIRRAWMDARAAEQGMEVTEWIDYCRNNPNYLKSLFSLHNEAKCVDFKQFIKFYFTND